MQGNEAHINNRLSFLVCYSCISFRQGFQTQRVKGVVEYNMYISKHVSLFSVCIVCIFCYMLLSEEEIKKNLVGQA